MVAAPVAASEIAVGMKLPVVKVFKQPLFVSSKLLRRVAVLCFL